MALITHERDIREAIAAVIQAADPTALVYNRWVLAYEPREWAGLLRSPLDQGRIHAWIMSRSSIDAVVTGNNCTRWIWPYRLWFFHYYATGADTGSPQDLFEDRINAVAYAFANEAAAITVPEALGRRDPLRFTMLDLYNFGGELVHFGQATLNVVPCTH